MALGTNLTEDLEVALANSDSAEDSAALIATAINNYLSGAVYGDGAVLWSSSVSGQDFELPIPNTPAQAAAQWGQSVMGYWGPSGVAAGTAGEPTSLDTVIPPIAITASTVGPAITTSLTSIFSNNGGTLESKASEIASAIESAVSAIVVSWSEFAAGPPPVTTPLVGGIS